MRLVPHVGLDVVNCTLGSDLGGVRNRITLIWWHPKGRIEFTAYLAVVFWPSWLIDIPAKSLSLFLSKFSAFYSES